MVANNFLGFSNCSATIFFFFDFPFEASSKSVLLKEKKATSAPDMRADKIRNTKSTIILVVMVPLKESIKIKLGGSGSKYDSI